MDSDPFVAALLRMTSGRAKKNEQESDSARVIFPPTHQHASA